MAKKMVVAVLTLIAFSLLATSIKPLFRPIPDINAFQKTKDNESWGFPQQPDILPFPTHGPRQERDVDFSRGFRILGERPTDWKVEILIEGLPCGDSLHYVISPGKIRATEEACTYGKKAGLCDAFISATEADAIFDACLRTLERFRFQDEPSEINDGFVLSISIYANSQTLTAKYTDLPFWDEAGAEVKDILNMIEAHLNKEKASK
jgi:hypothetical protein